MEFKDISKMSDEEKIAYLDELEKAERDEKIKQAEARLKEAQKQQVIAEQNKKDKVDPEDSDVAIGDAPMKQLEEDTLKELKERETKS